MTIDKLIDLICKHDVLKVSQIDVFTQYKDILNSNCIYWKGDYRLDKNHKDEKQYTKLNTIVVMNVRYTFFFENCKIGIGCFRRYNGKTSFNFIYFNKDEE